MKLVFWFIIESFEKLALQHKQVYSILDQKLKSFNHTSSTKYILSATKLISCRFQLSFDVRNLHVAQSFKKLRILIISNYEKVKV